MTVQHPIRTAIALILLGVLVVVCTSAGFWQLRRAAERTALAQAIEAGRHAPPITLSVAWPDGEDWHNAQATGTWLHDFTVLLDNRNLKGQPGLWVATPLQLRDDPGHAVLVLRGWVARPLTGTALPDLSPPEESLTVHGTMLHHVPRIFDLGSLTGSHAGELPATLPVPDGSLPRVQNLSLEELAAATGLTFLPVILEQAPVAGSSLIQEWPGPSLNADQNYGYAIQWFSFATIALLAALVMIWRLGKKRPAPLSNPHEDSKS